MKGRAKRAAAAACCAAAAVGLSACSVSSYPNFPGGATVKQEQQLIAACAKLAPSAQPACVRAIGGTGSGG